MLLPTHQPPSRDIDAYLYPPSVTVLFFSTSARSQPWPSTTPPPPPTPSPLWPATVGLLKNEPEDIIFTAAPPHLPRFPPHAPRIRVTVTAQLRRRRWFPPAQLAMCRVSECAKIQGREIAAGRWKGGVWARRGKSATVSRTVRYRMRGGGGPR